MGNLLGALFSWQVLVGVLAVAVIILVLERLLVSKLKAVATILSVLEHADSLIRYFMPDKYEAVYQALVTAANRIADGNLSQDEALKTSREVFDTTLKTLNKTLTDEEKEIADKILVFVVEIIVKDKPAAIVAVNQVCSVNGYTL